MPPPCPPQLVWSNLVSALTLLGPTLKHLSMEWPDELQLGAWAATLVALEVGSPRLCSRPGSAAGRPLFRAPAWQPTACTPGLGGRPLDLSGRARPAWHDC